MATSWDLNAHQLPAGKMHKEKVIVTRRELGEVVQECPKCKAKAYLERPCTSYKPGEEPETIQVLRCPNARSKKCENTVYRLGPEQQMEVKQMPKITEELKKRAAAASEKHGINNGRLAGMLGISPSSLNSVLYGIPTSQERLDLVERMVEKLEAEDAAPAPVREPKPKKEPKPKPAPKVEDQAPPAPDPQPLGVDPAEGVQGLLPGCEAEAMPLDQANRAPKTIEVPVRVTVEDDGLQRLEQLTQVLEERLVALDQRLGDLVESQSRLAQAESPLQPAPEEPMEQLVEGLLRQLLRLPANLRGDLVSLVETTETARQKRIQLLAKLQVPREVA